MSQLPNIIITDPHNPYPIQPKTQKSPIKQLSMIRSMDEITNDYLSLFGNHSSELEQSGSTLRNTKKSLRDSGKKCNIGMRIKKRLESTTGNKYQPLLTFLQQHQTSQFITYHQQHNLSEEKLYVNQSYCISVHQEQNEEELLIQPPKNQAKQSHKKSSNMKAINEPTSGQSKNNSSAYTYNNISAKTYYSSAQSGQDQSPIQKLNNLCYQDYPSVKQFDEDNKIGSIELDKNYERVIQLKQVPCDIDVNNIRMAESGVYDTPHQNTKDIQSVCYSCQQSHSLTPVEYAMKQLEYLKQNVELLERAANSLIVTKILSVESSVIMPSPIGKQDNEDSQFCSFLDNLQQNYVQMFEHQNDYDKQQSLLIQVNASKQYNEENSINQRIKQQNVLRQRINNNPPMGSNNKQRSARKYLYEQSQYQGINIRNRNQNQQNQVFQQ